MRTSHPSGIAGWTFVPGNTLQWVGVGRRVTRLFRIPAGDHLQYGYYQLKQFLLYLPTAPTYLAEIGVAPGCTDAETGKAAIDTTRKR